jgi:hypothetical protein
MSPSCRMVAQMALTRQLARLAKILVDSEGIGFPEAEARLRALTLEIVVGENATSVAAHAAVLTATSVGHRSFVGGVRVVGYSDQPLTSALPLKGRTLGDAAREVGANCFEGPAARRILVGNVPPQGAWDVAVWCEGWRAGVGKPESAVWGDVTNPLTGIAAGALAIGAAFQAARGIEPDWTAEVDLWPAVQGERPSFAEVFLPGALWLIGLGNLGQAFLWALGALPYEETADVELVLVDRDRVSEENWATSVLVHDEVYGTLKTKIGEAWCEAKGFKVRRVDRQIMAGDRLDDHDPRIALSGVDNEDARRLMAGIGFECIIDAGLGRKAEDFDRYRVTIFDADYRIDAHFAPIETQAQDNHRAAQGHQGIVPETEAYRDLEAEIGRCGAAEIAGASVAAPYVSAVVAAVVIARTISLFSGCGCFRSEVGRVRALKSRRLVEGAPVALRTSMHAGRPKIGCR